VTNVRDCQCICLDFGLEQNGTGFSLGVISMKLFNTLSLPFHRHPIFSSFLARHSCRHIIRNFHHAPTLTNRVLLSGYANLCRKRAQLLPRLGRAFGKSAPQGKPDTPAKHPPPPPPKIPTQAEQRKTDFSIAKRLLVNVWPKDDWKTRSTVLGGFGLLITAKVCSFIFLSYVALGLKCLGQVLNVQVPLLFKSIVDALNVNMDVMASSTAWFLAGSLIIGCTPSSSSSSHPPHILTRDI